jgi:hypothetical protein
MLPAISILFTYLTAQAVSCESLFTERKNRDSDYVLSVGEIREFNARDGLIGSGCAGPCSVVFIYHPTRKILSASHIADYVFEMGNGMIEGQFANASKLFPLKEAHVFVTGVAGAGDHLLQGRRDLIEELIQYYSFSPDKTHIEWLEADHSGFLFFDTKTGSAELRTTPSLKVSLNNWRTNFIIDTNH